jgi:hypothetical protein
MLLKKPLEASPTLASLFLAALCDLFLVLFLKTVWGLFSKEGPVTLL